jgi:hypothetical protein
MPDIEVRSQADFLVQLDVLIELTEQARRIASIRARRFRCGEQRRVGGKVLPTSSMLTIRALCFRPAPSRCRRGASAFAARFTLPMS